MKNAQHQFNPLKHVRGRIEASCSCAEWFRYTDDDGEGETRMQLRHAEHLREVKRKKRR